MRLCVVNEFFYPDDNGGTSTVLSGLVKSLREQYQDVEIDVITSRNRYRGTGPVLSAFEDWMGVRIHRLDSPDSEGAPAWRRLWISFLFAVMVMFRLLRHDRYDLLLVSTAPPLLAMAAQIIKFLTGTPYIYVLYDLEPDRAVTLGVLGQNSPVAQVMRFLQKSWLKSADLSVAIGRCMQEYVVKEYSLSSDRVVTIQNGADDEEIRPLSKDSEFRRKHGLDGFVVGYTGNFGRYHNFDTVLDAAKRLTATNDDIHFVLVGDGAQKAHVTDRIEAEQIRNVHLFSYVPRGDYADLLASADVSLVTLEEGMEGLCVPSKFYSILASGRPILALASAHSEICRELEEAECGVQINQRDTDRLVDVINDLYHDPQKVECMGQRARIALSMQYSNAAMARKYYAAFNSVTAKQTLSPVDDQIREPNAADANIGPNVIYDPALRVSGRTTDRVEKWRTVMNKMLTPSREMVNRPLTPKGDRQSWLQTVIQNNIVAVILLMVILVPLITGTDLLNSRGKVLAFELAGIVLLALTVAQVRLRGSFTQFKQIVLAGPNLPIIALVILAGISFVFSPFKALSLNEFLRISFCGLLYFAVVYHARGKAQLQALTDGLLFVTFLVSILGLAQMSIDSASPNGIGGTFGSHELLGSFLMLMLPISLALGLSGRGDAKRQLATQVVALVAAACLLMARSRSAWVGEGVALAVLALVAYRYQTVAATLGQKKHMVIGPIVILVSAISLFVLMSQTGTILGQRARTLSNVSADLSFQTRLAMWRGTEQMIAAKPILGWGVGTYPVYESKFTGLGESAPAVVARGADHDNLAHNFYLQTAAELGVAGLGIYLAMVVAFLFVGIKALGRMGDGLQKSLLMGCLAAVAGQSIDALASPAYNFASVSLFQWLLIGIGMSAAGLGKRNSAVAASYAAQADTVGVSFRLVRGFRYAIVSVLSLALVGQVIPLSTAALAQSCGSDNTKKVVTAVVATAAVVAVAVPLVEAANAAAAGAITGAGGDLAAGDHVALSATLHGTQVADAVWTTEGDSQLFTTTTAPDGSFVVTRTAVPGPGSLKVTAKFVDSNGKLHTIVKTLNAK